jgi:ectoine hydroxylase-related dioxygenase (phytanoyl-CoA dioxygenase family)
MPTLTPQQIEAYHRDGYLMVEDAVSPAQLAALRRDFDAWVAESRGHAAAYGEIMDGRPRFDLEAGHTADRPALRRVNSPHEVSEAYYEAMAHARLTGIVADLIGPDVKFHHAKINSKLPGAATAVKWHQDFPFTPHSNDDLCTALLFVDEVTDANGPLEVLPGSHRGDILPLWHDGRFTGAIDDTVAAEAQARSVRCIGPAGAVCLMHTRLLHGSAPNRSDRPRTLYICVYSAEDALALSPNPVPSRFAGTIVAGSPSGTVRSVPFRLRLPKLPKTASFFNQQAGADRPASYDG